MPRRQHAELRRHNVKPLGVILADPVKRPCSRVDVYDGFSAQQMGSQRAKVRAALSGRLLTFGGGLASVAAVAPASVCSTSSSASSI